MSEGSRKRSGADPHPDQSKRGRGPNDCLNWDSSDEEPEFTPFTQEDPVRVEAVSPGQTSSGKKKVSKKSVAKNQKPSKSKGKCLGELLLNR